MLYHFGNYTLETDRRALSHSGTLRHLEPKVFDLLRYLVEQRARVVSRDELYAHVWGETHVSDASLSYCISAARKAVGDTGRTQHVIKTIHGRGYAFVAAVTVPPHEPTPSPCDASPPRSRGAVERSVMPTAEWRQLTVLWCCVSLTPAPARLPDAEERYQVLREVHTLYGQIVRRLQGYMAPSVPESYPRRRKTPPFRAEREGVCPFPWAIPRVGEANIQACARCIVPHTYSILAVRKSHKPQACD